MNDLSLIAEVIAYYENDDQPFSYHIMGMLDAKRDVSDQWLSLGNAYLNGEFTPSDCCFMYEMLNSAEV